MGLFSRGIDVKSGIVFEEGWFRSGTRPHTGRPTAEIYSVTDRDDPVDEWWLVQQEILSRTPRWKDDYFQIWAEVLAWDPGRQRFAGGDAARDRGIFGAGDITDMPVAPVDAQRIRLSVPPVPLLVSAISAAPAKAGGAC